MGREEVTTYSCTIVCKNDRVKIITNDVAVKIITNDVAVKIITNDRVKIITNDVGVKIKTNDVAVKIITNDRVKIITNDVGVKIITNDVAVKIKTNDRVKIITNDDKRQIDRNRFKVISDSGDRPKIVVKNNGEEKNITITIDRGRDSGKEIMMMVQEAEKYKAKGKKHKKKIMANNALGNQTYNTKITINYKIQNLQISGSMEKNRTCSENHELLKNNCKKCEFDEYTCGGCKVVGFGNRYRCDTCGYNLHSACMHSTPTTTRKLLDSTFKFYDQLPSKHDKCKKDCAACGKKVEGFFYHCHKKDLVLHPCCGDLKKELEYRGMKFHLRETESKCAKCAKCAKCNQIKGWSYVSECGQFSFHVYCTWEMLYELIRKQGKCLSKKMKKGKSISIDGLSLENLELPIQREQVKTNSGMRKKWLQVMKAILQTIVSIFIGDPTTALASILVYLISNYLISN